MAATASKDSLQGLLDNSREVGNQLSAQVKNLLRDTTKMGNSIRQYQSMLNVNMTEQEKLNALLSQKKNELNERERTINELQDMIKAQNDKVQNLLSNVKDALLGFSTDELTVREDGLAFGYAQVDETKRIITQVSYVESTDDSNLDSKLVLKIATGTKGHLEAIPAEELVPINVYIGKLKFAGTRIEVVSCKGDVLVPRLTVFYDGAVPEAEMYDSIETRIRDYIMGIDFDAAVYVSRLTDAIRRAKHVTDVHIDGHAVPEQGVFIASHDTDGHIQPPQRIARMAYTASGYLKESSGKDEEDGLPNFREAIILKIENHEI